MESRHKSEAGLALSPLDTIEAAARMMRDTGSHLLPVVKDGALVGVISERDIVTRFVAEGLDGWLTRVSDFMTKSPITFSEDGDPDAVIAQMDSEGYKIIPMVDAQARFLGMVTAAELRQVSVDAARMNIKVKGFSAADPFFHDRDGRRRLPLHAVPIR